MTQLRLAPAWTSSLWFRADRRDRDQQQDLERLRSGGAGARSRDQRDERDVICSVPHVRRRCSRAVEQGGRFPCSETGACQGCVISLVPHSQTRDVRATKEMACRRIGHCCVISLVPHLLSLSLKPVAEGG